MIKVTEKALTQLLHFKETHEKDDTEKKSDAHWKLRIVVVMGGCSGMSYQMAFDNAQLATDETVDLKGLSILIDPKSAELLKGATLDYYEDADRSGFVFDNPNARPSCEGCCGGHEKPPCGHE